MRAYTLKKVNYIIISLNRKGILFYYIYFYVVQINKIGITTFYESSRF